MAETRYQFRDRLLTIHESNVRNYDLKPSADQLEIKDGVIIEIGNTTEVVIQVAANDFADFFKTSMGINATVSTSGKAAGKGVIKLALAKDCGVDLKEADGYKGFLIEIGEGINVYGNDDRGVAAALYYMEDLMCMEKAPFLKKGEIRKKPLMAPLMVHSGYGMEEYPDNYLMRIAHEGRDAILIFVVGINKTRVGYLNFNDVIARAARYGIDVYAYSFLQSEKHPDDDNAEEYYDSTYGELFRQCPGFKGVTLVGEVVEMRSKDPHVSKFRSWDAYTDDLPDGKFWPGWYPCEDVARWAAMLKRVVHNVKPDADIVLWTYNWGFQPEEDRIKLIENLPEGITLEATFEMFDTKKVGDAYTACSDYSLAFAGPGPYFVSEAKAAKKRGIKLYAMTQASGTTWDFGCSPYEPMPYQWMKRYEGVHHAIREWGLCGAMDNHHHGFYPSIITKFSKHAFLTPVEPMEEILDKIFKSEYGAENLEKVQKAFKLWSEAITYYTPTEGDFTAASRVGPSYPFCLFYGIKMPFPEGAMFGTHVVNSFYGDGNKLPQFVSAPIRESALNIRILPELESLKTMLKLLREGVEVFESIENKNDKLLSVINHGKYLVHYVQTVHNAKLWHILKCKLNAEFTREGSMKIIEEMEQLLHDEIENAKGAIPCVEADSRLGWEPSMTYLCDKKNIEWKIRQVNYVLDYEIVKLKKSIMF